MFTRDFVGGVAAIAIGAVYLFFAYQLRVSALDDSMGPGGMPRIYGWLLVGLGGMLVLQSLVATRTAASGATARLGEAGKGEWDGQGRKLGYAAGLLAIGIGYLFVLETLGYLVSVALLIVAAAAYLGAGLNGRVVAIGIFGALFLWATFSLLLGVRMPAGVLAALGV